MVSSYNGYLRAKMQQKVGKDAENTTSNKSMQAVIEEIEAQSPNEEEIDVFVFHTMTSIRREYVTQRCKGEEETIASSIPTFDEYVR